MEKLNKEGLLSRIELTKEMFEEAHKDMGHAISNLNCIEREVRESIEEKKYFVVVIERTSGYLNRQYATGTLSVADRVETSSFQTMFTEKEIKEMPNGKVYWLLREGV